MRTGNGIDLAAIYQLLTEVAEKVADHDRRFDQIDRRFDQIDRRFEQTDRRLDDHAAKFNEIIGTVNSQGRKLDVLADAVNSQGTRLAQVADEVTELRQTLNDYHGAVTAHGVLYSELDERVHRIERHLGFDPVGE